jgi:hypothetical protein
VQEQIAQMLDSITCTILPPDIHKWYNDIISLIKPDEKHPRAADIEVPDASLYYTDFVDIAMKKSLWLGMHGRGFSCEKGKKGKYMCRLVIKRGLHNGKTCLLLVILFRSENVEKKIKVDIRSYSLDEHTIKLMKTQIDALSGEFKQKHPMGPVVWEQMRKEADAYYCENNLIATNIQKHASNSSPITNEMSGKAAEEYLCEYMVKEKASLKQSVPALLAALDEITVHPSKAQDTGKTICTGKRLIILLTNYYYS